MAEITTTRPINTTQLCAEMGGVSLRVIGPDSNGNRRVSSPTATAPQLTTAVNAHVAGPITLDAGTAQLQTNALDLALKALAALSNNDALIAGQAARTTAINTARGTATAASTATITTLANAQTHIRAIGGLLVQLCNLLDNMTAADVAGAKQSSGIIREVYRLYDTVAGT